MKCDLNRKESVQSWATIAAADRWRVEQHNKNNNQHESDFHTVIFSVGLREQNLSKEDGNIEENI